VSCICVLDCKDHYDSGARTDGVYNISVQGMGDTSVYCDMTGGGRTVLQRRYNGDVLFNLWYVDYINGFGDVAGDHWLGLELMHLLTTRPGATNSLLIAVVDAQYGMHEYMNYANVWVDDRDSGYKLHVTSTAQDRASPYMELFQMSGKGLHKNDGWSFSTINHDVDARVDGCAHRAPAGGGWWYNDCSFFYINADFGDMRAGGKSIITTIMSVIRN
jgi:hypothetical protein